MTKIKANFTQTFETKLPIYCGSNDYYNTSKVFLDLDDGNFTFETCSDSSCSSAEIDGTILSFKVRKDLTADQLNDFADQLIPLFQDILDRAEVFYDGSNWTAKIEGWEEEEEYCVMHGNIQNEIYKIENDYDFLTYGEYEVQENIHNYKSLEELESAFSELHAYESVDLVDVWEEYQKSL